MKAVKGEWVQVERIILPAGQRAAQVPEDTQQCDLKMWVKGELLRDAEIGEEVEVLTNTGRTETGRLVEVNPGYTHNYGEFQPELLKIEKQLKEILFGGEK